MLETQNLSVGYGSRLVLQNINLRLAPGSILGMIGPNGAGKSTLVKALSGILPSQAGRILVEGKDLRQLSDPQRARYLAVVPQARHLPPAFTAWETVALGRTPYLNWLGQLNQHDLECIQGAMQRTDTLELAERRVGELSGGEQQRLLLARALAQAAPILLLDEPTAHLDLQYQFSLLDLLRQLTRQDGLSVLLVVHDLNLVGRYADQVGLLVKGELRALGTPAEVLDPELLSQAYHIPLEVVNVGTANIPIIIPLLPPQI